MSDKLIETDVPVVDDWRAGLFVQLDAERNEEVNSCERAQCLRYSRGRKSSIGYRVLSHEVKK